jgi:iron(II)-dependent oxidoreductase
MIIIWIRALKRAVILAPVIFCVSLLGCSPLWPVDPGSTLPGMVYIPAGNFLMGSTEKDGVVGMEVGLDEMPQHQVYVKGFYIDRYEVTNGQYYAFVVATGGYTPATWDYRQHPSGKVWPLDTPPPGEEENPVTDVDWYDAEAYCKWAGKRLPTEAEWEKAARGTDGRLWPWGNTFDPAKVNTLESDKNWSMPVGSYPQGASPYGLYDMIGNAWEWTASWYQAYPGSTLRRAAFGEKYRVLRGGSYLTPLQPFARVAHRYAPDLLPMELRDSNWHTGFDVGFRCAKTP